MERTKLMIAILLVLNGSDAQDLTITPALFTAAEGSQAVSFTCDANNAPLIGLAILVDDLQPTFEVMQARGIWTTLVNSTRLVLTIEPTRMNNNTQVKCLAVVGSSVLQSSPAVLLIQGTLSAPPLRIMALSSPANSLRLSWSAPFTLDISNQESDIIGYKVCYVLLPGSQSPVCGIAEDNTYDFVRLNLPMEFSVTPINVAGEGNTSTISQPACNQDTGTVHLP